MRYTSVYHKYTDVEHENGAWTLHITESRTPHMTETQITNSTFKNVEHENEARTLHMTESRTLDITWSWALRDKNFLQSLYDISPFQSHELFMWLSRELYIWLKQHHELDIKECWTWERGTNSTHYWVTNSTYDLILHSSRQEPPAIIVWYKPVLESRTLDVTESRTLHMTWVKNQKLGVWM